METNLFLIDKIYGDIFLKKSFLFGLFKKKISIKVGSNDKIFELKYNPDYLSKKLNLRLGSKLDYKYIIKWCEENDFDISFYAKSGLLRRKFLLLFGDKLDL